MDILYDYEIFMRQKYGGISRYFYELINGLSLHNENNLKIFLGYNNISDNFCSNSNISVVENKLSYPSYLHFFMHYFNNAGFNNFLNNYNGRIFHKTYYSNAGLKFKGKIISTVHDMTHEKYPEYFSKGDTTIELKKKTVLNSDGIICVSNSTKNDLIEIYGVSPDRINVIYHGISLNDDNLAPYNSKKPYILFIGQRWGYKNFNSLLSVYSSEEEIHDNYDIICFGGGHFNYSEKLFIKKAGLEKKVKQISGNDDLLVSLYKGASVLVYTSIYEGFGFPPLEALKLGCPVLTSPAGSVKEIAGDSVVYFDPLNMNELLSKLKEILHITKSTERRKESGKLRANEFTWEKSINRHSEFYKSLL